MRYFQSLFWIAVYLGLVLTPVLVLLVGDSPTGRGFWTDFSLALGYAAIAMMGIQFVLTARFRRASAPFGIDIIYYFHRIMAVLGFLLIVAHALILLWVKPGFAAQLRSMDLPAHTVAALLSFALLLALVVSSLWRKPLRIRYEHWRLAHGALAIGALALAAMHIEWSGYYIGPPWKRALWTVITLSWALLLGYVRVIKPWRLLRTPYRVVSVTPERGDAWTVALEPAGHAGLRFEAGQFAWLTFARSPYSLSEHPFSIASSAERPRELRFTIKELGDFTRTMGRLQPGTRVCVDGPYGAFTLAGGDSPAGYVFVAGGVGMAPIMSMLRTLADRGDQRPHVLIYGNWTWERVLFREELEALQSQLNLRVVHVLQEAPPGWDGETGLLTQELLRRHLPEDPRGHACYICGPKPMIALVERGLHRLGVPLRQIHSELFDLV